MNEVHDSLPQLRAPYRWRHDDEQRCWKLVDGGGVALWWVNDEYLADCRPDVRDAELAAFTKPYR